MSLPGNVTLVWVRGHFIDGRGAPLTGKVQFTCTKGVLVDPDADVIIQQGTVTAALDEDGKFAVQLIATDSAGVSPTNFEYRVSEPTYRAYRMVVPASTPALDDPTDDLDGEQVVDLSDVQQVTGNPSSTVQLVVGPAGPQGPEGPQGPPGSGGGSGGAVDSVNGQTGDVVLGFADLAGAVSDAQIPSGIARDSEVTAAVSSKADVSALTIHVADTSNPHAVSKAQVGLGNADNTSDTAKPVSTAQQTALSLKADQTALTAHTGNASNPHSVTKSQVGLGNADNTSDAAKPVSSAAQTALNAKADLVGGFVPAGQLPSFVDDVVEAANFAVLSGTGESGKIYVTLDDNKTYRWGGSSYVVISDTLALGETSATAYRGDRGKTAFDHSQVTSGNPHGTTKSDMGLGNVDNTSDATKNSATATLTNKTLTAPAITSPTGIVKGDVGLGSVDNTSDATKNSAAATLTNKTITAPTITAPTGVVKGDVGLGNVDNTSNATERAATRTLTNARVTKRVGTTASSSTPTADADSHDLYTVTALAANATVGAPTGTPTEGQPLLYRFKDNGTSRTLAWNAAFRALGVTLPAATVISKTLYVLTVWNATDGLWDVLSVGQQA